MDMKKILGLVISVLVLSVGVSSIASAKSTYLTQFNSKYNTGGTALDSCTLCHPSYPNSYAQNLFGDDFASGTIPNHAAHAYDPVLEGLDSDKDTFTNIVEITARTFPGDSKSKPGDTAAPTISSFTVPSTSTSLTVAYTIGASDNVGVTGYKVTETSGKPGAQDAGWGASSSGNYVFATAGAKTLYAWAKDAANNVSNSASASVTIDAPNPPPSEMDIWLGKWFKVTVKQVEYAYVGGRVVPTEKTYSTVSYVNVKSWDPENKILQIALYAKNAEGSHWSSETLDLQVIDGSNLDFLCTYYATGPVTDSFVVRIKGMETDGVLQSATFRTIRGYYLELKDTGPYDFATGDLSIRGSMIPESKVPAEIR